MKDIYIVLSFTNTVPGKMIVTRSNIHFYEKIEGGIYSHVSLSMDKSLTDMVSFARKNINNPFIGGLVSESIYDGMFLRNKDKCKVAVIKLEVEEEKYVKLENIIEKYFNMKDSLGYNYLGLAKMLVCGKGIKKDNKFFCSEWVSSVLKESGIDIFNNDKTYNIRPFDFYNELKDHIIYEGELSNYQEYEDQKKKTLIY